MQKKKTKKSVIYISLTSSSKSDVRNKPEKVKTVKVSRQEAKKDIQLKFLNQLKDFPQFVKFGDLKTTFSLDDIMKHVRTEDLLKMPLTSPVREFLTFLHDMKNKTKYSSKVLNIALFGDVDHGKTSLIKRLFDLNIKESGNITQKVSFFRSDNVNILDTPGHKYLSSFRKFASTVVDIAFIIWDHTSGISDNLIEIIETTSHINNRVLLVTKSDLPKGEDSENNKSSLVTLIKPVEVFTISSETGAGCDEVKKFIEERTSFYKNMCSWSILPMTVYRQNSKALLFCKNNSRNQIESTHVLLVDGKIVKIKGLYLDSLAKTKCKQVQANDVFLLDCEDPHSLLGLECVTFASVQQLKTLQKHFNSWGARRADSPKRKREGGPVRSDVKKVLILTKNHSIQEGIKRVFEVNDTFKIFDIVCAMQIGAKDRFIYDEMWTFDDEGEFNPNNFCFNTIFNLGDYVSKRQPKYSSEVKVLKKFELKGKVVIGVKVISGIVKEGMKIMSMLSEVGTVKSMRVKAKKVSEAGVNVDVGLVIDGIVDFVMVEDPLYCY